MTAHDEALRDYSERFEEQPDERFALSIAGEGLSSQVTPDKRPVSKAELGRDELASISYPKGIYHSSMKAKLLRTFFYDGVVSKSDDAVAITAKVMETLDTAQSPEKIAALVQEFIDEGYIVTEITGGDEYTVDLHEDLVDIGNKPLRPLEFVVDGKTITVDAKDMRCMSIKQLVMTEILHMSTYDLSGVPQAELLAQFLGIVKRNGENDLDEILEELSSDGMVRASNSGDKTMTLKGKTYIINFLSSINATKSLREDYGDEQTATRGFMEEAVIARQPIIIGPNRGLAYRSFAKSVKGVEQNTELSTVSADILEDLKNALKAKADSSIDTGQVVLGIDNWQEAALVISEISEIINDGVEARALPKADKLFKNPKSEDRLSKAQLNRAEQIARSCVWKIDAFVDSTTEEYIPVVLSIQKLYNAEELALASGLATSIINNYFRLQVIGNMITLSFNRDITIKDIVGIVKMDKDLEALYEQSNGQFDLDSKSHTKSKRIMHSGLNGILNLSAGKFAYYPSIASQSEWALSQLDETLLAQSE